MRAREQQQHCFVPNQHVSHFFFFFLYPPKLARLTTESPVLSSQNEDYRFSCQHPSPAPVPGSPTSLWTDLFGQFLWLVGVFSAPWAPLQPFICLYLFLIFLRLFGFCISLLPYLGHSVLLFCPFLGYNSCLEASTGCAWHVTLHLINNKALVSG